MYWLQRPPYLRWAAATLLVLVVLWSEFAPDGMALHPYLTEDVRAGTSLEEVVSYRETPAGVLTEVDLTGMVARHPLPADTPLTPAMVADPDRLAPSDWFTVVASVPNSASVGTRARLVTVENPGKSVSGIVLSADEEGEIAIPPGSAEVIATALRHGSLEVLTAVAE